MPSSAQPPNRYTEDAHYCAGCGTVVHVLVRDMYEVSGNVWVQNIITMGRCVKCNAPMVLFRQASQMDVGPPRDRCVFPVDARALSFTLTERVAKAYREAVLSERVKAWDGAVTMVGRTLEAVARDLLPEAKGMLAERLNALKDSGLISDELWEWSTELRHLRNIGGHDDEDDDEATEEDAIDALDFLQAVLETVYHFRPRFKKLQERRAKRKSGGADP